MEGIDTKKAYELCWRQIWPWGKIPRWNRCPCVGEDTGRSCEHAQNWDDIWRPSEYLELISLDMKYGPDYLLGSHDRVGQIRFKHRLVERERWEPIIEEGSDKDEDEDLIWWRSKLKREQKEWEEWEENRRTEERLDEEREREKTNALSTGILTWWKVMEIERRRLREETGV
jgi:hypothetical protein